MKKPLLLKLVSLMLLAVLLVLTGCQQANIPIPDAQSQAPATEAPVVTPEPVATPTQAPTAPAPTATVEVPASPTPTIEATATPTPTPAASATPAASSTPVPVGNSKYTLYVYVGSQLVVCYDSTGTPVKVMICSTGTSSTPLLSVLLNWDAKTAPAIWMVHTASIVLTSLAVSGSIPLRLPKP